MLTFRSKELSIFYEKFAQLYRAGVPIMEGLPLASMQVKDNAVRRGLDRVHSYMMRGRTLTEGFSQSPEVFSELQIALINVGEMQGRLDQTLMNLSQMYEREYKEIRNLLFALLYPGFLLAAAILLPPVVTWFTDGFAAYVKSVVSTSFYILAPSAAIYCLYYFFKTYFQEAFDRVKITIPVLGSNLKKLALARFSRSLATLFAGGIDLRRGLKLSLKALSNRYLERRCRAIERALDEGRTIADGMRLADVFPANLVQMVAIGERTGELDKMLNKAADYYEFEADKALKALLVALPIVIYLMVAAYIAYIVISFYAGYYAAIGDIIK
ncbi:MAG: type II secretion system F family protein [Acidobacteriota bacterium]